MPFNVILKNVLKEFFMKIESSFFILSKLNVFNSYASDCINYQKGIVEILL